MSVVVPGQNKGKSYIEHTAAQAGTSYKAKLKAAIDRLIPASADFEDLWGYKVHQGTVLYLALEDDESRLQRRMFRMLS